jgi:hypothetical protein
MLDLQIQYVKGIDLSPQEIEEAKRRFAEVQAEEPGTLGGVS